MFVGLYYKALNYRISLDINLPKTIVHHTIDEEWNMIDINLPKLPQNYTIVTIELYYSILQSYIVVTKPMEHLCAQDQDAQVRKAQLECLATMSF